MRVQRLATLGAARASWQSIAKRTANVFSTWEWAAAWWNHFGAGRRLAIASVSRGAEGDPVAIVPVYRERSVLPVPVVRIIGHGVADELGPICAPADAGVLVPALEQLSPRGVFLGERLPPVLDWESELAGCVIREDVSPVISLRGEGDWESYLMNRSANFRSQVRRRARRLKQLGIAYRLADAGSLERDMTDLIALHRARWQGRTSALEPAREAFHREFASVALREGWLRLWMAEADGVPVASWYGFRFAGVESYYQSGRDPAWDRDGVGVGMLEHTIRAAFEDGMSEYRLLRGDEQYKRRYCTIIERHATVAVGRRAHDRFFVSVAAALVPAARRRLAGIRARRRPASGPALRVSA